MEGFQELTPTQARDLGPSPLRDQTTTIPVNGGGQPHLIHELIRSAVQPTAAPSGTSKLTTGIRASLLKRGRHPDALHYPRSDRAFPMVSGSDPTDRRGNNRRGTSCSCCGGRRRSRFHLLAPDPGLGWDIRLSTAVLDLGFGALDLFRISDFGFGFPPLAVPGWLASPVPPRSRDARMPVARKLGPQVRSDQPATFARRLTMSRASFLRGGWPVSLPFWAGPGGNCGITPGSSTTTPHATSNPDLRSLN